MADITVNDFQDIALAISGYADERYTNARKINSTGIVAENADMLDVKGESYVGQFRWFKPISADYNTPSLTDSTDGSLTSISTDVANYVKAMNAFGAQQPNLTRVVTQEDGLDKIARDFTELRTQYEHDSVLATLKGVATSEAALGTVTGGITDFDDMPSSTVGMFVDLNAESVFGDASDGGAANAGSVEPRKLIDTTKVGASRGERLIKAVGMGFKDYEPDFMYMITTPEIMADLRAANLVDEDRVEDGNLSFQTILGGKFRLVSSRANQGDVSGESSVNDYSTKTTFLVKPGSVAWQDINLGDDATEIERAAAAYRGGGTTMVWYRHGFVAHPVGYDWAGSTSAYADSTTLGASGAWSRKMDPLNLGILPIFHA
jgi:hypothetical protein